jgi:hypothetical protein
MGIGPGLWDRWAIRVNFALKLSENPQVSLQRDLTGHRNGAFRPVLAPEYRPHPCSVRCSCPFQTVSLRSTLAIWERQG